MNSRERALRALRILPGLPDRVPIQFDLSRNHFDYDRNDEIIIKFESVNNIAAIRVNGEYVTTLWTSPWEADITEYVRKGNNEIEVEVANLWVNRIVRDMSIKEENPDPWKWPQWLFNKEERNSGRLSYATFDHYRADSPLVSSGLIGKAEIIIE